MARHRERLASGDGRVAVMGKGKKEKRASNSARVVARTSTAAAAFANVVMLSGNAQAQTTEEEKPVATTPEVIVRGQAPYKPSNLESRQYTEPLRDVPQSVTVVPRALIEEQNAISLRDVLRNVPGISMQAGEGGSGPNGDFLSLRGFSARNDIYVDNIRDFGGYSRDPFNIEQVEVAKGPASSYTGRGSTGGSINLVSKAPSLDSSFYQSTAGVGTDDFRRFTLDVNQELTPLWEGRSVEDDESGKEKVVITEPFLKTALRLNAMRTEGDVSNRNEVENSRWGIAPSLAFGFGHDAKLTLSYFHLEQDNVPDNGIPWVPATQSVLPQKFWNKPAPVDFNNFYGILDGDKERIDTDLGTLRYEQKAGDSFSLRNTARYGQTHRDSITTSPRFVAGVTGPSQVINREFQARDQTDTIIADQFDVRFSFETFGVKHELITGVDYAHETAENKLRAADPAPRADLYHPDPNQPYLGVIRYTGAVNESTSDDAAAFLGETMKFWQDKIQLSGGVRWDYYDAELDQRAAPAVPGGPALTSIFGRTDRVFSYRVALAYKPVPIGTFYVAYGTSFNPSAEGAVSSTLLTAATALLVPEENRTFEIGTKWDVLSERLALTAAVFRTDKTNARTPGLTPNDPPMVLDGEQRVQGFEIGVAGNITDGWKVFGGYTYLDSEILKSNTLTTDPFSGRLLSQKGNQLPQTPDHSFSLWTAYTLPWEIEVGAGASYVGRRFSATDNLREAPGYWLFDGLISKQFTKHIKAQVNIYNIADERYIDRVSGGHFVPGTGRTVALTFGFAF
jgi:catecholate siderophore receptor